MIWCENHWHVNTRASKRSTMTVGLRAKVERDCENELCELVNHSRFASSRALNNGHGIEEGFVAFQVVDVVIEQLMVGTMVRPLPCNRDRCLRSVREERSPVTKNVHLSLKW